MKIIIFRHEKVDMIWDKSYNSTTYDVACKNYDKCGIVSDKRDIKIDTDKTIYISKLSRTYETASKLFGKADFIKTALLNEVPLKSFKDTEKMYPLWIWNFLGRLQWFLQNERQDEVRRKTQVRAKEMVDLLEKKNEDCYIVSHGFYMRTLVKELKKQGYKIKRNRLFGISNLEQIVAIKNDRR